MLQLFANSVALLRRDDHRKPILERTFQVPGAPLAMGNSAFQRDASFSGGPLRLELDSPGGAETEGGKGNE